MVNVRFLFVTIFFFLLFINVHIIVLLPASALDELARMNIVWPIMFKVSNPKDPSLYTHCGVLEFSAEEGRAYVPLWLRYKFHMPFFSYTFFFL